MADNRFKVVDFIQEFMLDLTEHKNNCLQGQIMQKDIGLHMFRALNGGHKKQLIKLHSHLKRMNRGDYRFYRANGER